MFIALLLLFTTTAFATETEKSVPVRNYYEERVGYTGSDFFNGLDLPYCRRFLHPQSAANSGVHHLYVFGMALAQDL